MSEYLFLIFFPCKFKILIVYDAKARTSFLKMEGKKKRKKILDVLKIEAIHSKI